MSDITATVGATRREPESLKVLRSAWHCLTPAHWWWTLGLATFFAITGTLLILLVGESMTPGAGLLIEKLLVQLPTAIVALLSVALVEQGDRGVRPPVIRYLVAVMAAASLGGLLWLVANPASIWAAKALGLPAHNPMPLGLSTFAALWWVEAVWWIFTLGGTVFTYVYLRNHGRTARALAAAEARSAEARRRLLADDLAATQALADPVFLFDALRLIERSYQRDAAVGERILEALIAYLRAALPMLDEQPPTLGRQAELARAFLEIERERAGVPLQFDVVVPAELADTPLPPLLLLPLVDNAVRHGVAPAARGGRIEVRAHASGGRLFVAISDDGPGRVANVVEGRGIAALRERISGLFGPRGRLQLLDNLHGGITARIEVPYETNPRGDR